MFKRTLQVFDISFGHAAAKSCSIVSSTCSVKMCKHWLRLSLRTFSRLHLQTREIRRFLPISNSCQYSSVSDDKRSSKQTQVRQKTNFIDGPSLQHFIANSTPSSSTSASDTAPAPGHREQQTGADNVPYLSEDSFNGNQRKGCYKYTFVIKNYDKYNSTGS